MVEGQTGSNQDASVARPAHAGIQEFEASLHGPLFTPGEPAYDGYSADPPSRMCHGLIEHSSAVPSAALIATRWRSIIAILESRCRVSSSSGRSLGYEGVRGEPRLDRRLSNGRNHAMPLQMQLTVSPPSTTSSVPVMYLASSDARKRAA